MRSTSFAWLGNAYTTPVDFASIPPCHLYPPGGKSPMTSTESVRGSIRSTPVAAYGGA